MEEKLLDLKFPQILTFSYVNLSLQNLSICFYADVKHLELPLCVKYYRNKIDLS